MLVGVFLIQESKLIIRKFVINSGLVRLKENNSKTMVWEKDHYPTTDNIDNLDSFSFFECILMDSYVIGLSLGKFAMDGW